MKIGDMIVMKKSHMYLYEGEDVPWKCNRNKKKYLVLSSVPFPPNSMGIIMKWVVNEEYSHENQSHNENTYIKIITTNGNIGWVHANYVEVLS